MEKVDYKSPNCFVSSQTQYIERAFWDTGSYVVSDTYFQYKENPQKWVNKAGLPQRRSQTTVVVHNKDHPGNLQNTLI